MEKKLTKDLQYDASKSVQTCTAQVMQLGVGLHKTDSIVGCQIVYIIFLLS